MSDLQDIRLEQEMKLDFMDEVYGLPGGDKVKNCIQCGTCSGSCPFSFTMEKTPRQIFSMIRAGLRDEVLESDTIWHCASCYSCSVRCPKDIKIADVFYALKRISIKEKKAYKNKGAYLSSNFSKLVNKYGRNSEVLLLINYFLQADLFGSFKQIPLGWKLLSRGRLPLMAKKIKGISQIRKIIREVESIQANGGSK